MTSSAARNVFALIRTTRQDVQARPNHKVVEHGIPIPPVERSARLRYPWFDDVRRIGDSFHADDKEEVHAFRGYCYTRGWRACVRAEGDGWRCWRLQ